MFLISRIKSTVFRVRASGVGHISGGPSLGKWSTSQGHLDLGVETEGSPKKYVPVRDL